MGTYKDKAELRARAGFPEDQSVVPSAHFLWLITACNSCTRVSHTLFWSLKYLHTGTYIYLYTGTCIYLYRYAYFFKIKYWKKCGTHRFMSPEGCIIIPPIPPVVLCLLSKQVVSMLLWLTSSDFLSLYLGIGFGCQKSNGRICFSSKKCLLNAY